MSQLDLIQLLGGTLAKGALLLLLAAFVVRLRRRHSAAGRYAIWTATFAALLLLPALSVVLPPLDPRSARSSDPMTGERVMVMAPAMAEEGHSRAMVRAMAGHHGDMDMQMPDGLDRGDGIAWRRAARAASPWLLGAWLAGVLVVLFRLVRDVRRIAGVSRRAATLRRGPLHQLSLDVAAELGVTQRVRVALSRELAVPVSWGLFRPVVLLPAAARRWDPERRRVVLRHEMAHVRRGGLRRAPADRARLRAALAQSAGLARRAARATGAGAGVRRPRARAGDRVRWSTPSTCSTSRGPSPGRWRRRAVRWPWRRRRRCPSACARFSTSGSITGRPAGAPCWRLPPPRCSSACRRPQSTPGARPGASAS